jgi:hypothetical protein
LERKIVGKQKINHLPGEKMMVLSIIRSRGEGRQQVIALLCKMTGYTTLYLLYIGAYPFQGRLMVD